MGTSHSTTDRELLNALVALTTAFRRHFRRALEIDRFLSDSAYAKEVVDWLVRENDPALAQTTQFLRGRIHGPPTGTGTKAAHAPGQEAVPAGDPVGPDGATSADTNVGSRYVKGLR